MPAVHEKLAASLRKLEALQSAGQRVFRSSAFSRLDRERLLKAGFLQEAAKGWVYSSSPSAAPGDSTPWYASFWEFCASYCQFRFRERWHLSAQQSLLLLAENTVIPPQVTVFTPRGTNNRLSLPFQTTLLELKQTRLPPRGDIVVRDDLRLLNPAAALIRAPDAFFQQYPIEAKVILSSVADHHDVLARLLDGGHSVVAGRIVGALRHIGADDRAAEILAAMKAAGHQVTTTDPFGRHPRIQAPPSAAPIVARMDLLWANAREHVIAAFPDAPQRLPRARYLSFVEGIYKHDAYHSLSIEGYRVTPELVERVSAGKWNPDADDADRNSRDALAARGYWQAFQLVKATIGRILDRGDAAALVRKEHGDWYRALFEPSVSARLIKASALAGYRNDAVYLRTSRYVPPRWEAVRDAMPALFDLLANEPDAAVRAVLGHWMLGYIHPYPDGNGRMARFLMNAMLSSGGYPWTVIRVEDRAAYLSALESASVDQDIRPFARFIGERVSWSIQESKKGASGARKR